MNAVRLDISALPFIAEINVDNVFHIARYAIERKTCNITVPCQLDGPP